MPRGVYNRDKKSTKTPKTPKTAKTAKTAGIKTASAPRAVKSNLVALPTASLTEKFSILTNNLVALSHVRSSFSGTTGKSLESQTELEIVQHVAAIRALRQEAFGKTELELEVVSEPVVETVQAGNGAGIPLPSVTSPLIPVPQTTPAS
jgi:hypothetical protein